LRIPLGAGRVYVSAYHGTKYYNPCEDVGEGAPDTVEAIFPVCTLVGLKVHISANNLNGTIVVKVVKNGSALDDTAITVPAGATGDFSSTFEVSISDGDRICIEITENATSGTAYLSFSLIVEVDTSTTYRLPATSGRIYYHYTDGTVYFNPFDTNSQSDPSRVEAIFPACTLVSLRARVGYNTLDDTLIIMVRRNGINVGITALQIPARSTGTFSNSFNISISEGDRICILIGSNATTGYAYLAVTLIMEFG